MITIINLLSICIFGYVLYLKLEDWIKKHNSDQENNSYRVMFFIFVLVLTIDSVGLVCFTWNLISIVELVKALSWSFFGFALISLRVNTTLHQRVWNWVWSLFFRKPHLPSYEEIVKESSQGYQPTNTVDSSKPPKQKVMKLSSRKREIKMNYGDEKK